MTATLEPNAMAILEKRYLDGGTVDQLWDRASGGNDVFRNLMATLRFLPNSPTLFNRGKNNDCTSSACFTFDVEDCMRGSNSSIVATREKAIAVAKAGGGVGYWLSALRAKGSAIKSIHRKACGPVVVLKDYHAISALITQGGKRELAQMAVLDCDHVDIREFIHCKDTDPQGIGSFNISVGWKNSYLDLVMRDYGGEAKDLWNEQCHSAWSHGCPGMWFPDVANKFNPNPHLGLYRTPNPCVTGDTLVYVADGRGKVSIQELAKDEKDIPVFCSDNEGKIVIRMMRHPRVTGTNVPVYEVTLDDGSKIKTTANHKFKIRSTQYREGEYKEVRHLVPGDSLALLTRYTPETCDQSSNASRAFRYVAIGFRSDLAWEHELIARFHHGIVDESHVHHVNENRMDNRPENLVIVNEFDHLSSHAVGASNGNALAVSNDEVLAQGRILAKSLGRRFSPKEWNEFAFERDLPTEFTDYRSSALGTMFAFSKRCAELEGFGEYANENLLVIRTYQKALSEGFDASIENGLVYVLKKCENCCGQFSINYFRREQGFCSKTCSNMQRDYTSATLSNRETNQKKQEIVRQKQVDVYLIAKQKLGRRPEKKEWAVECETQGVSKEIARVSSPFRDYASLEEAAKVCNHKIVSVEFVGYEDVYNGTVDEFHNFFVGGWDGGLTESGRRREWWISNLNCGEAFGRNDEACNLGSLVLARYFDKGNRSINWKLLEEDTWNATLFLDDILTHNVFPHPDITAAVLQTRRLGLGVMGWSDLLAMLHIHYDTPEAVKLGEKVMGFIESVSHGASVKLANEHGPYPGYSDKTNGPMRRNESLTSIAPTGTIALIAGLRGWSIEPWIQRENTRTTSEGMVLEEKIPKWIKDQLDGFEPKIAEEIAPEWHVRMQAAFQKHTDLGVSKTINMANSATVQDVSDAYKLMYELGCKGGTIYRDGCRSEQVIRSIKTSSVYGNGTVTVLPKHEKMPEDRDGKIHKFRIGDMEFFLTCGHYADNRLGEIFVNGDFGTTMGGLLDAFCITFSIALQHGTPLEALIKNHRNKRFEPNGMTNRTEVPICTSICDLIVRWLEQRYLTVDETPKLSGMLCPDCGSQTQIVAGCSLCTKEGCHWTRCG